ncbi:hypothetical protein MQE36_14800 [Zhouia spongiae]|uniref:Secreted protein n=1 Tax=Zhouia spongiae TaxID=2202721 RepID=A0ABY3YL16_9FLAO|nr:hypothetical protein [Zhouia spongiae]UNY98342.1 hypothetical protein MQE36_14800 [Zhouia spongiae]
MKILLKYTIALILIFSVFISCTPPEDQIENQNDPEVLATGDNNSTHPDNDRD